VAVSKSIAQKSIVLNYKLLVVAGCLVVIAAGYWLLVTGYWFSCLEFDVQGFWFKV